MYSIHTLRCKRKKTDEDSIIEDIIAKGSAGITEKDTIINIFAYAVEAAYIHRGTYKDHNTYKIREIMENRCECSACGETLVAFDCASFEVCPEIRQYFC